jgi:hypothetical protein
MNKKKEIKILNITTTIPSIVDSSKNKLIKKEDAH